MLPVLVAAIECPTHSIVDAALRTLPVVLPVLDFTTIKGELFPVIATVFSKTNSLAIKVRGLRAFVILCGGTNENQDQDDGLNGFSSENNKKKSSSSALDKYTMQEKIVPLVRAIKTKEPAVMIAALNVLRIVGETADADFVAMDILPILWSMSLGPLLDLKQFQMFMELIKKLSRRVEDEQTRKLQELSGVSNGAANPNDDFVAFGGVTGTTFDQGNGANEDDFEALVKGRAVASPRPSTAGGPSWDEAPATASASRSTSGTPQPPAFSWSTPPPPAGNPSKTPAQPALKKQPSYRTVTPDLGRFESLTPSSTQFSQPLQPTPSTFSAPLQQQQQKQQQPAQTGSSINWSAAAAAAQANPWSSTASTPSASGFGGGGISPSMSSMSLGQAPAVSRTSSFTLAPPPGSGSSSFSIPPPPSSNQPASSSPWGSSGTSTGMGGMGSMSMGMGSSFGANTMMGQAASHSASANTNSQQRSGLDKYESLI